MKNHIIEVVGENFQSWKDLHAKFGPFTAIVGATDSGKSAILRLIKWVLYNEPRIADKVIRKEYDKQIIGHIDDEGNLPEGINPKTDKVEVDDEGNVIRFIQRPALTATGILRFSNGKEIIRCKGPKSNYYKLLQDGQEILHLESFGVGPVKEVVDFHGMPKVNFFGEKQSLNICPQMDKPFFLGESAPVRAVMIGRLAKADVVDLAIDNTAAEIRKANKEVKEKKVKLKETKNKLKELTGLTKMEKDLEKLRKHLDKANELSVKAEKLRTAYNSLKGLLAQKERLEKIIAQEAVVSNLASICINLNNLSTQLNTITKVNRLLLADIEKKAKLEKVVSLDTSKLWDIGAVLDNSIEMLKIRNAIIKTNAKLLEDKEKLEQLSKVINVDIDIDEVFVRLEAAKDKIKLHDNIKAANTLLVKELTRQKEGNKIMQKLESSYNLKLSEYKAKLHKYKRCPLCMSDITDEKISEIQDIV